MNFVVCYRYSKGNGQQAPKKFLSRKAEGEIIMNTRVNEIAEEIRNSDTWDNDLVDELINIAMEENEEFKNEVSWAYDFRENNYNSMGYFTGDDEDTRYKYENINWENWIYKAAEILGVEI